MSSQRPGYDITLQFYKLSLLEESEKWVQGISLYLTTACESANTQETFFLNCLSDKISPKARLNCTNLKKRQKVFDSFITFCRSNII